MITIRIIVYEVSNVRYPLLSRDKFSTQKKRVGGIMCEIQAGIRQQPLPAKASCFLAEAQSKFLPHRRPG